jgi:hypothetical protein
MQRVVFLPGAEQSATRVSLTALAELIHSDTAIPPRPKCFLLILSHIQPLLKGLDRRCMRIFLLDCCLTKKGPNSGL